MAKKKTNNKIDKLKGIKEKVIEQSADIKDFPLLSEEEMDEIEIVDNCPNDTWKDVWKKNSKQYWGFPEAYRLMQILMYWLNAEKTNWLLDTFVYQVLPKAISEGKVKEFPSKIVTRTHIKRMCDRWPLIKEMYEVCKRIQDSKATEGGMVGVYNASLVSLYLRTHRSEEWTETIKQEIVTKQQILNIDPFEGEIKEE